jgi:hypothetical protein
LVVRTRSIWPEREKLLLAAEAVRKSPQLRPVRLNPQLETAAVGKLSKALARLSRAADDVRKRHNPTLYAIADALVPLNIPSEQVRVVSVGVGVYLSGPAAVLRCKIALLLAADIAPRSNATG